MVIQIKDMENYGKSVPVRIPFMDIDPAEDGTMACTAYEYGMALAEAIAPHLSNEKNYTICVKASSGTLLQMLQAFPHSDGYVIRFVTDRVPFYGLVFQKRTEKVPDRYLIIVDPAKNLNNYYKMTDLGGGEWGATTGRIGERQGRNRRARNVVIPQKHRDYEFGIKLLEKLMNGYQDKSECHSIKIIRSKNPEATVSGIDDEKVADLIERLMRYAQEAIRENYTVSYTDVTEEMIRQANTEIQKIRESRNIRELNAHLTELMHIIPRRIDGRGDAGVKSMLAESMDQLADILEREKELLDIMEGQILVNQEVQKEENILDRMGITIRQATAEEYKEAESSLNGGLQSKLKAVYRVVNKATQTKFDEYIKEENPDRKIFWHGSKNRNWFSILQKGLLLNPDASVTGKMFGQGIYFAPSAMKSWGYTSSPVAKWTNECGKCAFMALFDTAYGKPFEVYDHHLFSSSFDYTDLKKHAPDCNCVHAKADRGMLMADEVIFYREDQVTVKYLCEFDV